MVNILSTILDRNTKSANVLTLEEPRARCARTKNPEGRTGNQEGRFFHSDLTNNPKNENEQNTNETMMEKIFQMIFQF
jgi:hypothetical protein